MVENKNFSQNLDFAFEKFVYFCLDPDPDWGKNPGSGSVKNESGSETLNSATLLQKPHLLISQVGKEFGSVMKKAFEHLSLLDFDEKTINSIGRVVHIWEERCIFDKKIQARSYKRT